MVIPSRKNIWFYCIPTLRALGEVKTEKKRWNPYFCNQKFFFWFFDVGIYRSFGYSYLGHQNLNFRPLLGSSGKGKTNIWNQYAIIYCLDMNLRHQKSEKLAFSNPPAGRLKKILPDFWIYVIILYIPTHLKKNKIWLYLHS